MEKGEFAVLTSKLDKLEDNLSSMQMNMHLGQNRVEKPADQCTLGESGHALNASIQPAVVAGPSRSSALRVSQCLTSDNDSTTDCTDNVNMMEYHTVLSKRKKRKYSQNMQNNVANKTAVVQSDALPPAVALSWSDRVIAGRGGSTSDNQAVKRGGKRTMKIVGRAKTIPPSDPSTAATHVLKSAKPYVRKAIYGVLTSLVLNQPTQLITLLRMRAVSSSSHASKLPP
jgi:hypothetical protein